MPPTPQSIRHHRRKRPKPDSSASYATASSNNGTIKTLPSSSSASAHSYPAFPLAAFAWPARNTGTATSQWITLPVILMSAGLFRWCTSLWPYSGLGKPPMNGDFEAQRHWMEVTTNLPVSHWYWHDLQWWGLDYPPLTAYHSWLLGSFGNLINVRWFQLYLSRGLDDADLKVFMRASVLVSEYLVYVPAAVICARHLARRYSISSWESAVGLTALLIQPATILIDHGHFQYNTVMLGLSLATISSILAGRRLWSCVFFVGALGFKQMALFYAPAVAAYLAGSCVFPRISPVRFFAIGIVTIACFALLYLPLLLGTAYDAYRSIQLPSDAQTPPLLSALPFTLSEEAWYYRFILQLAQSIHRIFPFARGLFEDKVANIWCALHSSGIHKLTRYSPSLLSRASLGLTLMSIAPPCLLIFFKPQKELSSLALAATAWGFFLCGFQVHEKNVLLPLLPMTLLLASGDGMRPVTRAWVGYANMLGCWTIFPLLARDELRVPYFVLTGLWAYLLGLPPCSIDAYTIPTNAGGLHWTTKIVHLATYSAMVVWHVVEFFYQPPASKPDLWVVANACLGAAGFGLCYLWCLAQLINASGILRDVGFIGRGSKPDKKKAQ